MGDTRRSSPHSTSSRSARDKPQNHSQSPDNTQPALSEPQGEPAQQQGLLHGDAAIVPGGTDEEGEFSADSVAYDAASLSSASSLAGSLSIGDGASISSTSSFSSSSRGEDDESVSLRTSIYEHSFANGRRYHRYRHGRYPIPNDEEEQNREDMLHAMMLEATDGRLFYAPIGDNPRRIIDLGTGTGLWAIEAGEMFPGAEVMGLDLSPIQPPWVPPNVKFYVDDVEAPWLNGSDFDFVHLRNMVPILKSPVNLLREAYANMRPGAWVELQDVDGDVHSDDDTVPPDWPLKRFTEYLMEGFAKFGTDAHAAIRGEEYLRDAGFVNIKHNYIKLPYGTWPKDKLMRLVGMYYRRACEDFFPAVGAMHFPMLGWSQVEMEVFFAECRNSMRDPNVHAYGKMHFWSGQKPWDA